MKLATQLKLALVVGLTLCILGAALPARAGVNPIDMARSGMIWTQTAAGAPTETFPALGDAYLNGGLDDAGHALSSGYYYCLVTSDALGTHRLANSYPAKPISVTTGGVFARPYKIVGDLFASLPALPAGAYYYVWIGKNPFTNPPCYAEVDRCRFTLQEIPKYKLFGYKFYDTNLDSNWGTGEPPLQGWKIELYQGDTLVASDETDINGYYEFPNLLAGTYTVKEVVPVTIPAWTQTYPTPIAGVAGTGVHSVVLPTDPEGPYNFGNKDQEKELDGKLIAYKFKDLNMNGTWDQNEPPIANWTIELYIGTTLQGSQQTDANGKVEFTGLLGGLYNVAEVMQPGWIATTPTKFTDVEVPDGGTGGPVYFGNIMMGGGGGHTPGYWSNNNGQATFNLNASGNLAALVALHLCNAAGTADFDPTTYTQFKLWLQARTATNMSYMLSAHLAAMKLNVRAGFVDGNATVYAGSTLGVMTINALIAAADAALASDFSTPTGDPNRAAQEALKNALDAANNNLNFIL